MDFQTQVESEKFLGILGPPYKSLCNLMTLKNGVILLGILDLIVGVFNLIVFIGAVIRFFSWSYRYAYFYFELLSYMVNIAGIVFAFIGIRGITKLNIDDLELYYKFEVFELGIESILGIVEAVFRGIYYNSVFGEVLIQLIIIMLSAMVTKVVWSALIRLKNNETVLVMHGEAVLHLMQQQAVNLANPKVITPGMPIYFASPSQQP
jgi:hypothetical protein